MMRYGSVQQTMACGILVVMCCIAACAADPIRDIRWTYSADDGKTFAAEPKPGEGLLVARATFAVDDPSKVAGLSVTPAGESGGITRGRSSEWKCPVLKEAAALINGKDAAIAPSDWIVYDRFVLDPAFLVPGINTLTVRGQYALPGFQGHDPAHHSKPTALVLEAFGFDKLAFDSGPVLGAHSETSFSVCCKTTGARAQVALSGKTDSGAALAATTGTGLYHRIVVAVPKGTKRATYSVAIPGTGVTAGPFEIRIPDPAALTLKFAAVGDSDGGPWKTVAAAIAKLNPDFVLHAGGMNYFPALNGWWRGAFADAAALHATIPMYVVRGYRDIGSPEFDAMFYRPGTSGEGRGETWTQVVGPVRLIGLGVESFAADSPKTKWLEATLKEAREKFIFVLHHPPPYSSDEQSRNLDEYQTVGREVVMPLLARYKVAAMVSANGHAYERSEPTPDRGVTALVAGASGGTTKPRPSGRASQGNPYAKVFRGSTHYMWFEVDGDTCRMEARTPGGEVIDTVTFKARSL